MVDKCSTVKSKNVANKLDNLGIPKIEGELYKIVESIKVNVDDFCKIHEEAKKIPSPHCSLLIYASENDKASKKNTKKNNSRLRLGSKKCKDGKIKQSNSAEDDRAQHTTLYLFKKALMSDNNDDDNKNEIETEVSQKSRAESSKVNSVPLKKQTKEPKTEAFRQRTRTPSPQTANRNATKAKESSNNKDNKSQKNNAQTSDPKKKLLNIPFIKKVAKSLKKEVPRKKKGQKEKPRQRERSKSPPRLTPITAIQIKKKESNKNIPTEKPSNNVSVYKSISNCSKSFESVRSQITDLEEEIHQVNFSNERNDKIKNKLNEKKNVKNEKGSKEASKVKTSNDKQEIENSQKVSRSKEGNEEETKTVEKSIKVPGQSTKSGKQLEKSANVQSQSILMEKSASDVTQSAKEKSKSKNKSADETTKPTNRPKSAVTEKSASEATQPVKEQSKSTTKSANRPKSPNKSTSANGSKFAVPEKSAIESTKISLNEQPKSANEHIKPADTVPSSANKPVVIKKSTSDTTKSMNEQPKSANESVKPAKVPAIPAMTHIPKPAKTPNPPSKPANKPKPENAAPKKNNKASKNPTQNSNQKQKKTNPLKMVQVLKYDQRMEPGKENGLETKRTKSIYHNMCTVSKPPVDENDGLTKPTVQIPEKLRKIKAEVDQAMTQKKIFTVCGNYYSIRKALVKRGWIEKMKISYRSSGPIRKLNSSSMAELLDMLHDKEQGWLAKRLIVYRLLANHPVDLFWDYSNDIFKNSTLYHNKFPLMNRLWTGVFGYSSKSGLCDTVKRAHWYQIPGVSCLNHPRTYNFAHSGDPHDFLEDYKRTAAMSVLKWIVERSTDKVIKLISLNGKIPLSMFEFALVECKRFIKICKHKDIDMKFAEANDFEWHQFFENFYALIHLGDHFKSNNIETVESLVLKSKIILAKIEKYFPYLQMDNTMNVWILKPCNGCRGIGIHLCRTLEYILTIVKNNPQRKYVIQKYIERPLLIHNTKFDIRQWFLISDTCPLTLWIYKESYIRLSSQTFNIRKLHESIHLTNNAIQARYRNSNRDPSLPNCNMWTLNQFKKYLELIGHPNVFDEVIFPGMKQNITCAIRANQERIYRKKNTFELYGSDFMITEDFKPWLLEINCRPALYGSTPVTAKLCPKVLEDTIKVIIDHQRDKKPNTSNFELLYKEKTEKLPQVDPESFVFHIRPLTEDYFVKPEHLYLTLTQEETKEDNDPDLTILSLKSEMKKTFEKLLGLIKTEKQKRPGLSSDSLMNNKEVQIETNTFESALKDVTVIMNLDHEKLPYSTNDSNERQLVGGMRLIQNQTLDGEIVEDDDNDEDTDLMEINSSCGSGTKDLAKTMITGFLHQLEKLE